MKNIIKISENDLHKIIKESVNKIIKENGDTRNNDYINYFTELCKETHNPTINLYFNDTLQYFIEKTFGNRFKEFLKKHKDHDNTYVAKFYTRNSGWGDIEKCTLSVLRYGGYGIYEQYLCDLTPEEFYRLLNNFEYSQGKWSRKGNFKY